MEKVEAKTLPKTFVLRCFWGLETCVFLYSDPFGLRFMRTGLNEHKYGKNVQWIAMNLFF